MSGPIVRKYGFPNFEQIFGKQEPQHGVDDAVSHAETSKEEPAGTTKPADQEKNEGSSKTRDRAEPPR